MENSHAPITERKKELTRGIKGTRDPDPEKRKD